MNSGPRSSALRRPRLDAELDNIFDFRAGEVTAPAGSGKTTLLKSWAKDFRCADVVWFPLERRHEDSLVLTRELVDAVRWAVSAEAAVGEVSVAGLVSHLVEVCDTAGRPTVIVFDDAQVLEGADGCAVLRELVACEQDRYRVVVAGRNVPDIGLEPLRRRGELFFLTAADLRLTGRETTDLVRFVMRSEPSEPDLAEIDRQVEGWALGAVLAGLVLDNDGSLDNGGSTARASLEGLEGHRYFDEFFGAEVFSKLSDDIQAFMLDTCVLEQLEIELCAEISGHDDPLTVLRHLEHEGLFVEWMGGQPPVYRYHALLRSWLQGRLGRDRLALARRAAAVCQTRGRRAEAIEYLLDAGDDDEAASLIVDYGPIALGEGRYEAMRNWIGALPKTLVSSNGPLLVLLAETEHRLGDAEAATAARALTRDLVGRRPDLPQLGDFAVTIAVQRGTELHRQGWLLAAAENALSTVDLTSWRLSDERLDFYDLVFAMNVAAAASALLFTDQLAKSAQWSRWVVDTFPADDRAVAAVRVRCLGQAALAELIQGARPATVALAREALAICRFHDLDPIEVGFAEMALLVVGPKMDRPRLDAAVRRRVAMADLPSHTCLFELLRAWSFLRVPDLTAARVAVEAADRQLASIPQPGMLEALHRRVSAMIDMGVDEPTLSPRDRCVLAAVAASGSRREAAAELHLSLNTVKTYATRIYRALGVNSLDDAVARCDALGIELPMTACEGAVASGA